MVISMDRFTDETGAVSAWVFLEDESMSADLEDVAGIALRGDESEVTRFTFVDAATGTAYEAPDVTVRAGALNVGVQIVDLTGNAPELLVAEGLAGRLLARIDYPRGRSRSDLPPRALRPPPSVPR